MVFPRKLLHRKVENFRFSIQKFYSIFLFHFFEASILTLKFLHINFNSRKIMLGNSFKIIKLYNFWLNSINLNSSPYKTAFAFEPAEEKTSTNSFHCVQNLSIRHSVIFAKRETNNVEQANLLSSIKKNKRLHQKTTKKKVKNKKNYKTRH